MQEPSLFASSCAVLSPDRPLGPLSHGAVVSRRCLVHRSLSGVQARLELSIDHLELFFDQRPGINDAHQPSLLRSTGRAS
jgi:hypothetical protein